ncbi:MAG: FecR family protein [Sulfuricella sp.]|nr:FecR family protein [Sulfuricella sp.]
MAATDDFGFLQDLAARERAAYWFARLRAENCSENDRRRFEDWLSENEAHRREYEQFCLMWEELDGLKSALPPATQTGRTRFPGWFPAFGRWHWAAAVLAAAVGIGWHAVQSPPAYSYATAKGEQKSITLPDGSLAQLNTDTRLTVEMSAGLRLVKVERGEALFAVAHEEARPFEVRAGSGTIRDIGTRFDVYRDEERVVVAVLDGEVEISLGGKAGDPGVSRALLKGQQAAYSDRKISAVRSADEKTVTAWQNGKLVFDGTSLRDVVRELGRYHDRKIVIADSNLNTLKVSGVFNASDLDGLLWALQQVLPIKAARAGNATVLSSLDERTPPRLPQAF